MFRSSCLGMTACGIKVLATRPSASLLRLLSGSTPCKGCLRRSFSTRWPQHHSQLIIRASRSSIQAGPATCVRLLTSGSDGTDNRDKGVTTEAKEVDPKALTQTPLNISVKVVASGKTKKKTDWAQSYTENIYITPVRAMDEFCLTSSQLDGLLKAKRRSPYPETDKITVFLRSDVEKRAAEVWGSVENAQKERQKRLIRERFRKNTQILLESQFEDLKKKEAKSASSKSNSKGLPTQEKLFKTGSGKVVLYAVAINALNCAFKLIAWLYTGSHSMFAECIHSAADTANQIILAVGLNQSIRKADSEHPYGWTSFQYISSLISGVGIFCIGAGLSWYHGVQGLMHPDQVESIAWAIAVLGGSFLSESATLLVAFNEIRKCSMKEGLSFAEYVYSGIDPTTNVVLLEDLAAVMGIVVAASCMGITYLTHNPMADAVGSLLVGTLLGGVASFIIYTNIAALVGRSIPMKKKTQIMHVLETDRMIRALHDVKATDMGSQSIKFKAEVDFDGKELTRLYLEKQDLDTLLAELQKFENVEEVEAFMLKHGENIVDTLGEEVDRIEKKLKQAFPEIRHVDLEQL